jgi:hypothetical protein
MGVFHHVRCRGNNGHEVRLPLKSAFDPGCVKTPIPKLPVETFISISSIWDMGVSHTGNFFQKKAIQKQLCTASAQARFHTAWTQSGHSTTKFCCDARGMAVDR